MHIHLAKPPLAFFLFIFLISCKLNKNSNDDRQLLNEKIRHYLSQTLRESDSTKNLDSVRLIRIDILAKSDIFDFRARRLIDSLNYYQKILDVQKQKVETNRRLASLYNDIGSSTLTSEYSKDAEASRQELMATAGRAKELLDTYKQLDSLGRSSDSLQPLYFETVSFIQVRNNNGSIVRDTARVITTLDHEIITMNEFEKQAQKIK